MIEARALLAQPLARRLRSLAWGEIAAQLDELGYATTPALLSPEDCEALAALYDEEARFRSKIVMARHGYGSGEYQYFGYPLPRPVAALRRHFYACLAPIANRWAEALGAAERYPDTLEGFLARCRAAGQTRPTPLLLRYAEGDYNCLHQDLYGDIAFPLQVAICLSRPGEDFTGGEFLLVEQRPRRQSRGEAVTLGQGEAVVFPNAERPVAGGRGFYRVKVRHGVSRLRAGRRTTLGLIFHDAR